MTKSCDYISAPTSSHLLVTGEENKEICGPNDIYRSK